MRILLWLFPVCLSAIAVPNLRRIEPLPDPATRPSHYPLLTGDTFRAACDYRIDETCRDFDPTVVQKGSTIFVAMPFVPFFFDTVLSELPHPIILVTSNGDGTIDESCLPKLELEKILHWFGRNVIIKHPKITCIPLGVSWWNNIPYELVESYFARVAQERFFAEKPVYCYFNVRNTTLTRQTLQRFFLEKSFSTSSPFVPFKIYMMHLAGSRFVLSPKGFNIDCFRTWEALYAGSIPVVESGGIDAVYEGLPVIIVDDIHLVTEELLNDAFEKLKKQTFHLERLHADYWLGLIKEVQRKHR